MLNETRRSMVKLNVTCQRGYAPFIASCPATRVNQHQPIARRGVGTYERSERRVQRAELVAVVQLVRKEHGEVERPRRGGQRARSVQRAADNVVAEEDEEDLERAGAVQAELHGADEEHEEAYAVIVGT